MKKKVIIPIAIMLLLAVGAFCAFLIHDAYVSEEFTTGDPADIATQIAANRNTAFSFLQKDEKRNS